MLTWEKLASITNSMYMPVLPVLPLPVLLRIYILLLQIQLLPFAVANTLCNNNHSTMQLTTCAQNVDFSTFPTLIEPCS